MTRLLGVPGLKVLRQTKLFRVGCGLTIEEYVFIALLHGFFYEHLG